MPNPNSQKNENSEENTAKNPENSQKFDPEGKIPDSEPKNGQKFDSAGKISDSDCKNVLYNFDQDYEYLRPPLYAMTLKKKDILSREISIINSGIITSRQIYHDHSTYTAQEVCDFTYWKQKVLFESRGLELSSFWSDAEIFRMVDSPFKPARDQPHLAIQDLYRGYSRVDLIYLLENWVKNLTWQMTD